MDLVRLQHALRHLLEVPSDENVARGSHNRGVLSSRHVEVVESGRGEVDALDLVLGQVLHVDLKLLRHWLLLTHPMLKASLAVLTQRGNEQEVSLTSGHDPVAIDAHVNGSDRISQTRQQGLGVLANLLVQSDFSVQRSNRKSTLQSGTHLVKLVVGLVDLLLDGLQLVTRVQREDGLLVDTDISLAWLGLAILDAVGDVPHLSKIDFFVSLVVLDYLAAFKVELIELTRVFLISENKSRLLIVKHYVVRSNNLATRVFELRKGLIKLHRSSLVVRLLLS